MRSFITLFVLLIPLSLYGQVWEGHVINSGISSLVSVNTGDIDGDGDIDVLGRSEIEGDDFTHNVWFENVDSVGTTWLPHSYQKFGTMSLVQAADLDGDGDLDIIGVSSPKAYWWENADGEGTDWDRHDISEAFETYTSLTTADMDGDGDLDIVSNSAAAGKAGAKWYENAEGDASTWTEHGIDTQFAYPEDINPVDMDGDGDMDLVATEEGDNRNVVWSENTDGTGTSWTSHTVDTDLDGEAIIAFDVDLDGDMDIVATGGTDNEYSRYAAYWYENTNGDGSAWDRFILYDTYDEHGHIFYIDYVRAADLDHDGDMDIILSGDNDYTTADKNYYGLLWLENTQGDKNYWPKNLIQRSFDPAGLAFDDLNGDGYIDVIAGNDGGRGDSDYIKWWKNKADISLSYDQIELNWEKGELAPFRTISITNNSGDSTHWSVMDTTDWLNVSPKSGSLDRGASVELTVSGENFPGEGTYTDTLTLESSYLSVPLVVTLEATLPALFINQRDLEITWAGGESAPIDTLVLINYSDEEISWEAHNDSTFLKLEPESGTIAAGAESEIIITASSPGGAGIFEDVISIETAGGTHVYGRVPVKLVIEKGWTEHAVSESLEGVKTIAQADMDNDGDLDIIAATAATEDNAEEVCWYENSDGMGTSWTKHEIESSAEESVKGPTAIQVLDLDGDEDMDVFVAGRGYSPSFDQGSMAYWENLDGSGTSWEKHEMKETGAYLAKFADLDNDERMDLIFATANRNELIWSRGSSFSFENTIDDRIGSISSFTVGDFRADDDLDVIYTDAGDHMISLQQNLETTNTGGLTDINWHEDSFDDIQSPMDVFAVDMDHDANIEMVIAGNADSSVVIMRYEELTYHSEWIEYTVTNTYAGVSQVQVYDLDGDGDQDIVGSAFGADSSKIGRLTCWFNEGESESGWTWLKNNMVTDIPGGRAFTSGDIDGDGDMDMIVAADSGITWLEQKEPTTDTGIEDPKVNHQVPGKFAVDSGYPNPFNPSISIPYHLPEAGRVQVTVFNIVGQKLMTQELTRHAGNHTYRFNAGAALSSGMYFIQFRYGNQSAIQKVTLIK